MSGLRGHTHRIHGTTATQLDRQLHLGHRRRRAPRPLRPRQVPRRDPADDRPAPARRRARADQAGRARHEGVARQGRHRPTRTRRSGRPPGRRSTTPRKFTLRDLQARASQQQLKADFEAYLDGFSPNVQEILDNFEFRNQIPRLSKADALGTLIEKFSRPDDQPEPEPGAERRRLGEASRPRQPRDGHDLRGAGPPLQRGEQRGGRRALDAARRRQADGEADLPADRRPDRVRHLPALRRRLRHRRHAHRRRGDAAAARRRARQAGRHPPLRPGDQRRDLRHLQGRPAAQGRGRGGRQHRRRPGALDARRTTPSRRASSTSCSPTRPTARAGRATSSAWAARTASRTRASSSSTPATPSTRSSPAPATARCCSWPTCSRR